MSLTKDDLRQIKAVMKESFSDEFPKAFAEAFPKAFSNEYPRLRKEMHLIFAQGINELILPQFDQVWKRFDEIADWQEQTDEILQTMHLDMKRDFRFLVKRTEENAHFTDEVDIDNKKLIGEYSHDFVKKADHEALKKRVKKLELTGL